MVAELTIYIVAEGDYDALVSSLTFPYSCPFVVGKASALSTDGFA